ncbi:MAG: TetR family transcriptional regulator C-terminal domain-containing protein [Bacteroidota bacterium]
MAAEETQETKQEVAEKIRQEFITYVLEHGRKPASIYKFAKSIDLTESEFYNYYTSFEHLEQGIWEAIFTDTNEAIRSEEVWTSYSVREKLLAFFYTLVEVMKRNRSYILVSMGKPKPNWTPTQLKKFKEHFKEFAMELISEGIETQEVVNRPYLTERYHEALWGQALFLINYWVGDDSAGFERTDAAIEKAVNLGLDLLGKGIVDSVVDFAKFMFQSR